MIIGTNEVNMTDTIKYECPNCKVVLRTSALGAGSDTKCPKCNNNIKVPTEAQLRLKEGLSFVENVICFIFMFMPIFDIVFAIFFYVKKQKKKGHQALIWAGVGITIGVFLRLVGGLN